MFYGSLLWAMERRLVETNEVVGQRVVALRKEFQQKLGPLAAMSSELLGPLFLWATKREERRSAAGCTYEPSVFVERTNW